MPKMSEYLRKLYRVLKGKDFFYRTTVEAPAKRFGSAYGGWWVLPGYLDDHSVVLSIGLGEDVSFDLALHEATGCTVHGFDPTPKSLAYLKSIPLPEAFHIHPYALSEQDGELRFNLPQNSGHVSGSLETIVSEKSMTVECKRLETIMDDLGIDTIDLLKMDIEGSEYKVIEDLVASDIRPGQLLVEYHHFFDSVSNAQTKKSIALLLANGYALFRIEGYNYSFVRENLLV
jgi:FkbM family methyltransferase